MEYPVQQKRGLNQETITIALLQVGELNLSRNMDGGTFNKKWGFDQQELGSFHRKNGQNWIY